MKNNAASVPSDLGGGGHRHLGIMSTGPEYTLVSEVPYARPVYPGPLVIPPGTAGYMRSEMRDDHKEGVRVFREVENVDHLLKKQMATAIPSMYIKSVIIITLPIP